MFREIVTSSVTLANSGIVVGGNVNPAVSGLTVIGDVSATGKVYGNLANNTIQNFIDSTSLSSFQGKLNFTQISDTDAKLNDVIKYQELAPGVSAWSPGKILVGELTDNSTLKDGALVTYSETSGKFVAKDLEKESALETSYIKKMGKCAGSRNAASTGSGATLTYSPGYAAITTDNRVIAWGNLHTRIFGGAGSVLASENVRVPFWTYYDGYTSGANYKPYGGDFFDQAVNDNTLKYVVDDLYWSRNGAMALVSATSETGGDVWVAGTNSSGTLPSQANPKALVKTKFNNFLIANETAGAAEAQTGGLYLFNPDKDLYAIQKYAAGVQRDIIADKTNSDILSTDSFYYISDGATIKRVTHFGELCATRTYTTAPNAFAAPNGLAMAVNDNGKDLLYVCDFGASQHKIKLFDITNNGFNFLSAIGSGLAGTGDGSTDVAQFSSLKKIAIDPTDQRILYVSDANRIRRLWRKANGHYRVDTISDMSNTAGDTLGELKFTNSPVQFNNPYGIKVSPDGKSLYIVDQGNKKIKVANITVNTEIDFSAQVSNYVDANVQTAATFNTPYDVTRDGNGNLYIADYANHKIRKIAFDSGTGKYGLVTTFAGTGAAGLVGGPRLSAKFNGPTGITYSSIDNSLYVVNYLGHQISRIDLVTNQVSLVMGGAAGYAEGYGTSIKFNNPLYIKYGTRGGLHYLWVTDYKNHRVRQIQFSSGTYNSSTLAGTGTAATALSTGNASSQKISFPTGLYYDVGSDSLYFTHLHSVQKIRFSDNQLLTVIGKGIAGTVTGNANIATFNKPYNIFAKGNNLYLCDQGNFKIRKITNFASDVPTEKVSSTFAGSSTGYKDGIWSGAKFSALRSLILDYNNTDFIVVEGNLIRRIYNTGGVDYVSTVDGKTVAGNADSAITPITWDPYGIDVDDEGEVFFSEIQNDTVGSVKTDPTGGPNKVEIYRRMAAGHLGIGEGSAKSTCGFIKVKAIDKVTGTQAKFKRIQFVGDDPTALLFAALDTEDSLWLWGNSVDGAFGTGQKNSIGPTKIYSFEKNVADFQITCSALGRSLISVITKDGKLFSAGDNNDRQLGRGETAASSPSYSIFKQCKKSSSVFVDDAVKIIEARETGYKNNLYINTSGNVFACGDFTYGVLGRQGVTVDSEYFVIADVITDVRYLIGTSNGTSYLNHTIFAIKNDDTVWSWGYNGVAAGQCLSDDITSPKIESPVQCYNFETKDVVRGAKYLFVNDGLPTVNQSTVGFLDGNGDLYLGGFSTDADIPDFNANIPYFRKFNMRNISPGVNLVGEQALIHRNNGTVYTVNRYGAKKVF